MIKKGYIVKAVTVGAIIYWKFSLDTGEEGQVVEMNLKFSNVKILQNMGKILFAKVDQDLTNHFVKKVV